MKINFLTFQVKTKFKKKKTGANISPVELMAYRSGSKLKSELENRTFNYTNKAIEDEIEGDILMPDNAVVRYKDFFTQTTEDLKSGKIDINEWYRKTREHIWNDVQKAEIGKQSNSRFCREIIVSLPNSLSKEQSHEIIKKYLKEYFVNKGMIADYNIHWKKGNHHAHILLTTRAIDSKGNWGMKEKKDYVYQYDENGNKVQQIDPATNKPFVKIVKVPIIDEATGEQKIGEDGKKLYTEHEEPEYRIPVIDKKTGLQKVDKQNRKQWKREVVDDMSWNTREQLIEWRLGWEKRVNMELKKEGIDEEICLSSYKALGLDKLGFRPTKHEGSYATEKRRVGEFIDRSDINNNIKRYNRDILMGYPPILMRLSIDLLTAIFKYIKSLFETNYVRYPDESIEEFKKRKREYQEKLDEIEDMIIEKLEEAKKEKTNLEVGDMKETLKNKSIQESKEIFTTKDDYEKK